MRSLNEIFYYSAAAVCFVFLFYLLVSNVPTKWSARAAKRENDKQKKQSENEDKADARKLLLEARRERDEYMALWNQEAAARRKVERERDQLAISLAKMEAACARAGQSCREVLRLERKEDNGKNGR